MPRLAHTARADCSRSPRLMRRGERDEQGTGQEEGTEKEAAQDDEGKKGREARQERFQAIFTDVSARRPTDEKKARHCPGLFFWLASATGGAGPARAYGSSAVHSAVANLSRASASARDSSSARSTSGTRPPWRLRKVAIMCSITALRGRPVCRRSGSTRFRALVVPLSDSFSRPMRSTSSILFASMS